MTLTGYVRPCSSCGPRYTARAAAAVVPLHPHGVRKPRGGSLAVGVLRLRRHRSRRVRTRACTSTHVQRHPCSCCGAPSSSRRAQATQWQPGCRSATSPSTSARRSATLKPSAPSAVRTGSVSAALLPCSCHAVRTVTGERHRASIAACARCYQPQTSYLYPPPPPRSPPSAITRWAHRRHCRDSKSHG